jgi:hypothetical protein
MFYDVKSNANVVKLGTAVPTPVNVELNPDDKEGPCCLHPLKMEAA